MGILSDLVRRRQTEYARMRKALEFYANGENWKTTFNYPKVELPKAELDAGKKARQALGR